MHKRTTLMHLVLAGFIVTTAGPALAAGDPAIGRWNLTVDTGTYTHPSWLVIEMKEGKHVGRFLGSAGSVGDIGEVKVEDKGLTIKFSAHDQEWTGTIKGDTVTGTRVHKKNKEDKSTWTGQRSVHNVDLTGRWCLKRSGVPAAHPAVLGLKQEGAKITGTLKEGDATMEVRDAQPIGIGLFRFSVEGSSGERRYSASVKGDVLNGLVGSGRRRYTFTAYRQREWGEPVELFNGKDLENWKPLGDPDNYRWKVIDGVMTNTGGGGSANVVSKEKFRDFRMHVEFKVPRGGNSGVYLRGRHEIQVSDSHGHEPSWHICGALYSRIAPNVNAARKHDEWQTFDVTLIGAYLTVVHNGQVIIDNEEMEGITGGALDSKESEPGPIYLQGDHGPISYRKITIWPAK